MVYDEGEMKIYSIEPVLKPVDIKFKEFSYKNKKKLFDFLKNIINPNFMAEFLVVIMIDDNDIPMSYYTIGGGSSEEVNFEYSMIIRVVLLSGSNRFILVHNHPFGSHEISNDDIKTYKDLRKISKMLNLQYLGDYIITNDKLVKTRLRRRPA